MEESIRLFKDAVDKYQHLVVENVRAATGNTVTNYLIVSRKLKVDHSVIGPHDAVRLVVSFEGKYKFVVYENIVEEGDVGGPNMCNILSHMNEPSWIVCPGVTEYNSFKNVIGYNVKGVSACSWPPDTARDTECQVWYHNSASQQSDLCGAYS